MLEASMVRLSSKNGDLNKHVNHYYRLYRIRDLTYVSTIENINQKILDLFIPGIEGVCS